MSLDLLPVPFGEHLMEEAPVFRQDVRIPAVAETLEQLDLPLDVH